MSMWSAEAKPVIRACVCTHAWQDRTYGTGMRLMNPADGKRTGSMKVYRCTVCMRQVPA